MQILFCTSVFFTFLEIVKYVKNVVFPSIFSIKITPQKFTNIDVFFPKNACWYDICQQYNLAKLFQMKLKT